MEGLLEPLLFSVFVALPIVAALFCLYYAFRYVQQIRLIEDTPTSKIRSAAQGYVELSGTAHPIDHQILISPITQTTCVWYRCSIEVWQTEQTSNGPTAAYQTLQQAESNNCFLLVDNTDECIVDPSGSIIIPLHCTIAYGYSQTQKKIQQWSFWFWLIGTPPYRYREFRIHLNDPIQVSGNFKTLSREEPLVHKHPDITDYFESRHHSSANFISNQDLPPNHLLLLSAIPENRLIRQYRWKIFLFLILFLFFCIVIIRSMYPLVFQTLLEWNKYFPRQIFETQHGAEKLNRLLLM